MASEIAIEMEKLCSEWPLKKLPERNPRDENLPHAPSRNPTLSQDEKQLAVSNALRYFPPEFHETLGREFAEELEQYGHIYMYRLRPTFPLRAYPVSQYPSRCPHAAAIMCMIMNNLDHQVAQYPEELVTYGGNGQVFSNWAQFRLTMHYLSEMTSEQTLVMYSGHPLGLFPSHPDAPRVVITNGMVIPNYSSREMYERLFALGVTMYGQMTAGSYCYIGPQGIVHGTTLTIMNAGRKYLGLENLAGKVLVTSGLGGMSGAQAKAAVICGCIAVIAEVSEEALEKRFSQGWLMEKFNDLDRLVARIRQAREERQPVSIGYHGNVVDVWEKLVEEFDGTGERLVDLGTDQTSCHNPYVGGYYPVQLSYEKSREMIHSNPKQFQEFVKESLCRQVAAINRLAAAGMSFWDYGNAFLLEAGRAGAGVFKENSRSSEYRFPSYVQDIMGDIFSLGFGPFRWVCTSGEPSDLAETDRIAAEIFESVLKNGVPSPVEQQYNDNLRWIKEAGRHQLVVGSQARILYSDQKGRIQLALAFNEAVSSGKLRGPVVISRDHHDVSGTDSPFRETSDVYDGSSFCADMAVQNVIGDSFRGATWVALHNGGGVGWGEVINGGFGLVLDGTVDAERRAKQMLNWDVSNGVTRRCWSGNERANIAIRQAMKEDENLRVTLPFPVTWSSQ